MTKSEWGVPLWSILHKIAAGLPETISKVDLVSTAQFFLQVSNYIPCAKCRVHYNEWCKSNPPTSITGRAAAVNWVWRLHNTVNSRSGKPEFPFEDLERYNGKSIKSDVAVYNNVINRRVIDRRLDSHALESFRKWMYFVESVHHIL
jgi:hypothetical protein